MDSRLNMSQEHALVVKKANCLLGCISRSITLILREVIITVYSTLLRHIWRAGLPVQETCGDTGVYVDDHEDGQGIRVSGLQGEAERTGS